LISSCGHFPVVLGVRDFNALTVLYEQATLDDAENARLLRAAGDAYGEEDYKVCILTSNNMAL